MEDKHYKVAEKNPDWYWGMGTTAEAIVKKYNISREDQDKFAYKSNMKAVNAIEEGLFKNDIIPYDVTETYLDENEKKQERVYSVKVDEGPRKDTTIEKLSKLKPVFSKNGTATSFEAFKTQPKDPPTLMASYAKSRCLKT